MPIPTHDMPTIRAAELGPPPAWALLQRQLISTMEEAADYFVEKYCRSDLSTYYVQDVDDIYEIMHNWGLFYALGGADRILDYALGFWNATTRYYEDTGDRRRGSAPSLLYAAAPQRVLEPEYPIQFRLVPHRRGVAVLLRLRLGGSHAGREHSPGDEVRRSVHGRGP